MIERAVPIMVAMSGGVDSSVTAALLARQGYAVIGVFMRLAQADAGDQAERARRIAERLGITLEVVDLQDAFQRQVLDYFSESYLHGLTPNPCVVCNRTIKFGLLRDVGRHMGIERMATGHYARTVLTPDGRVRLLTGLDAKKDQSYFLCALGQEQLAGATFPLGETTKDEVYQVAAELGLNGLHSAESQDICFMQGRDLAAYFADLPLKFGDCVTRSGKIWGRHQGIHRYTVGQRRGLGIPDASPWYVIGLDTDRNQVIIGKEEELWQDTLSIREMHWVSGHEPNLPQAFMVKIRYRHQAAQSLLSRQGDCYTIRFSEPQRAITPGQFAALYLGDEVIGGGAIL
ncbi:MAG: tRNA 2-thiouridine(34) synthase MnmA [Desulfobulbaceae bacterium]|nr:tRNA 2-thiouridine(34) synthase MnmA [Desulfobulbaceae bacterium]